MFNGPEEAWRMKVISFVPSLLGVTTVGCKWRKYQGNGQDVGKGISNDVSLDVEF